MASRLCTVKGDDYACREPVLPGTFTCWVHRPVDESEGGPMTIGYRLNRIPREQPHGHHCNECGTDWRCERDPCLKPPNAPFSLCEACMLEAIAKTLAWLEAHPK